MWAQEGGEVDEESLIISRCGYGDGFGKPDWVTRCH